MTRARIQPYLRKLGNNLRYYKGKEFWPRFITERNKAFFLHIIHFCLIWESENVSFIKIIRELRQNFKVVDNYITK